MRKRNQYVPHGQMTGAQATLLASYLDESGNHFDSNFQHVRQFILTCDTVEYIISQITGMATLSVMRNGAKITARHPIDNEILQCGCLKRAKKNQLYDRTGAASFYVFTRGMPRKQMQDMLLGKIISTCSSESNIEITNRIFDSCDVTRVKVLLSEDTEYPYIKGAQLFTHDDNSFSLIFDGEKTPMDRDSSLDAFYNTGYINEQRIAI